MAVPQECRWWASFALLALFAGCEPAGVVSKPAAGPPPPPGSPQAAGPPAPPGSVPAGVGVVFADDEPAGVVSEPIDQPSDAAPPLDRAATAASAALSGAAALLPNLTSDEAAIHRMFAENLETSRTTDGKLILDRCHPDLRSEVIIGIAQFGYFFLGADSEVSRMVDQAGLLGEKYQPLFEDLKDHQLDLPANRALADEAAARIRDPARLVTLVREIMVGRMQEAKYELVSLTVEGDKAAGVCLVITRGGTEAKPFAAEKVAGTWYATRPTPAALAKVKDYEANPPGATVSLPPRKEVRVTAEQLAAEFHSDPHAASRKYGSPYGPVGPMGPIGPVGPIGPGGPRPPTGPQGLVIRPELPPPPPDHDTVLEGTVAYRLFVANTQLVYLITPAGRPSLNLTAGQDKELAASLAAAEPGQTVRAVVDAAAMTVLPIMGPGTITVTSRQVVIEGRPARSFGPIAAADFFRELADPMAVARYQGRPVILTGEAVVSQPQALMVGLSDGQRGMVGCQLAPSERKALQAVKRGQQITVRGTYIQPHGRNQIMLQDAVFAERN